MTAGLGALAAIAARKRAEADELRCAGAALWAKAESLPAARDISAHLRGGKVIAEIKRRSPSAGTLREGMDCAGLAVEFVGAGAAAISVLTDGPGFGGSLDDLAAVRGAVQLPLLRKDFVVDPFQVAEARVAGADWVLLIVALLDGALLDECLEATERCHARAIVEVHSATEADRAIAAGAQCIGVNNRDLRTLQSDIGTFSAVRRNIPDMVLCVAESGMRGPEDVSRMITEGADAVLVGEALMRAPRPASMCAELVATAALAFAERPR